MMTLFLFCYHLFGILFLPLLVVYAGIDALCKPQNLRTYLKRLSLILPQYQPKEEKRVWIHAVSVGEVLSCEPLIKLLLHREISVWLSTGTEAGFETAKKSYEGMNCFFFPFDFWFSAARFLKQVNPDMVLLCELEIWPSFVWNAHRRGIPMYLVSGRMVEKDFRRYRRFRWFFSPVFSMFSGLFMQNETYTRRMEGLCPHPRLKTLGSLKFDAQLESWNPTGIGKLIPEGFTLCAASTHRGDERLIIGAFKALLPLFPQLKLVLVPRHPRRSGEIIGILEEQNLTYTLRSEEKRCEAPVFIVDTLGEMMGVYEKCEIVIIGGSFSRKNGGHNIIEPALYRKCILCGNHMENFEDMYALFKRERALVSTHRETLIEDLKMLILDTKKAARIGERAFGVIQKNRGVSERIYAEIFNRLP